MTRLAHKNHISLLAVLLLCLSWSVWLQGNHVHIAEHTALDACVACHYNAAALPSTAISAEIIRTFVEVGDIVAIAVVLPLLTLRPLARAPPVNILVLLFGNIESLIVNRNACLLAAVCGNQRLHRA